MKILHFAEYASGGVNTYLNTILSYQDKDKEVEEIIVLVSDYNSGTIYTSPKVKVLRYEYKREKFFKSLKYIRKTIKQVKPDIIHMHSTFAGVMGRIFLFKTTLDCKKIYCAHGWSFFMKTSIVKKLFFLIFEMIQAIITDVVIDISDYEHQKIKRVPIIRKKSKLIENGVEDKFEYTTKNIEKFFSKKKINLLFVGRFDYQKGLDRLIELFKFKKSILSEFHLSCIGEPILNSGKVITFPRNFSNIGKICKGIDSYYNMCDVVIIPSRWEGFGLVAVEAMKNSKPIIVSDVGQLSLFVIDNKWKFNLDDPNSLFTALEDIYNNREKLKKYGVNYRKAYEAKFNSEIMNNKIKKIYIDLLKNK